MKNIKIFIAALLVTLLLNGCSAESSSVIQNNESSASENENMIPEETDADDNSLTEVSVVTTEETATAEETKKHEKTAEERLKLINSTEFYGFNTEPYPAKGSGPEKPENFFPPDYFFYCEDAVINDPVLKEMINSFTEESRKSITADFERFAAFYNFEFMVDDISDFITEIKIINNCCIVIYRCEFNYESEYKNEFFQKTGRVDSAHGDFAFRCAYFDISEHRRLELSDLFFKDYDFTTVINRRAQKNYEYVGGSDNFSGLNQEFMTLYPQYGNLTNIGRPLLTPYSGFSFEYHNDYEELYFNCCVYSEPIKYGSEVYTGKTEIKDIRNYTHTVYGVDKKYPGMLSAPLKSTFFSEEFLEAVKKKASDDLGEYIYPDPIGDWVSPDRISCSLNIEYLNDYDIFYAYIHHNMEACRLYGNRRYYDAKTLEPLSLSEVLTAIIGENWQDYFENNLENRSTDCMSFLDNRTDYDRLVLHFRIIDENEDFLENEEISFRLTDGKWIADSIIKKENE